MRVERRKRTAVTTLNRAGDGGSSYVPVVDIVVPVQVGDLVALVPISNDFRTGDVASGMETLYGTALLSETLFVRGVAAEVKALPDDSPYECKCVGGVDDITTRRIQKQVSETLAELLR